MVRTTPRNIFAQTASQTVNPDIIDVWTPLGYEPTPKQQIFHDLSAERIHAILYGGAAGGGKSCALLMEAIHCAANYPGMRIGCFRRTYPELEESFIGPLAQRWGYARALDAKWNQSDKVLKFPNGSVINFTYAETTKDASRILGGEYQLFCVDECTLTEKTTLQHIEERLRSGRRDLPVIGIRFGCVDEGDVLTESGWKPIQDVAIGERVYSASPDGTLELKNVTETFKDYCPEPLVRVRAKGLYMSMTQNHRVVYQAESHPRVDPKRDERRQEIDPTYRLVPWNEYPTGKIRIVRTSTELDATGLSTAPVWDVDTYLAFLGLFLAEGSTCTPRRGNYKVLITQLKPQNQDAVRALFEATGYNYCLSANGDWQITNKALWEHFSQFGKAHEKYVPRYILNQASKDQLALLWKWMALGDGHDNSGSTYHNIYTTTSSQLADDVCELAIKLGYKVGMRMQDDGNPNHRPRYVLSIRGGSPSTRVQRNSHIGHSSLEDFDGMVYCLRVEDNENFVLRQRGTVWISGNSNPGGISQTYFKKRFVDATDRGAKGVITDDNGLTAAYIPAKLADNPHIGSEYDRVLDAIADPIRRKQMRDGDWSVASGMFFEQWSDEKHIISREDADDWVVPKEWMRYCGIDYGIRDPWAVIWVAVDPDGRVWAYREIYAAGVDVAQQPKMILEAEANAGETHVVRFADPSIWGNPGTNISIADTYGMNGCGLLKADNHRPNGWTKVHHYLNDAAPPCWIHKAKGWDTCPLIHVLQGRCPMFIETMPALPRDETKTDDARTRGVEDHMPDAVRYVCSGIGAHAMPIFHEDDVTATLKQLNPATDGPPRQENEPGELEPLVGGMFGGNIHRVRAW